MQRLESNNNEDLLVKNVDGTTVLVLPLTDVVMVSPRNFPVPLFLGDCLYKIAVEAAGLDTSKPVVSKQYLDPLTAQMAAHLDLNRVCKRHLAEISDVDRVTMFRRIIEGNRIQVLANTFIDELKEGPQRSSCGILLGIACKCLRDARRSLLKDKHFLQGLKNVIGDNYGPDYLYPPNGGHQDSHKFRALMFVK